MRLFGRKSRQRLRELGESEAYHHSYGEPPRDVKLVKLPQAFAQRLDKRDKEE
jgi:hypothetical protein